MRRILLFAVSLLTIVVVDAQGGSIEEVLQAVRSNNMELQANEQWTEAQKLEAKSDNNLQDPTISYARLWGRDDSQLVGELVVTQEFDFPTLYVSRNKLNRMKSNSFDAEAMSKRQAILLQAKVVCLDIIMLRQQDELLQKRLRSVKGLSDLYEKKLAAGDANIIETNKINLELLNINTEAALNQAELKNKIDELTALNGNIPISFKQSEYEATPLPTDKEALFAEVLASDPSLKSFDNQNDVLKQQIAVDKQGWIPKLNLGYRRDTDTGNVSNGIVAGASIPLFQNRYKVKIAKARLLSNSYLAENTRLVVASQLAQDYREALSLYTKMGEYQKAYKAQQDLNILRQAVTGGEISMIEYFVEVSLLYQSKMNYLLLENQYQKLMAEIYKFRL